MVQGLGLVQGLGCWVQGLRPQAQFQSLRSTKAQDVASSFSFFGGFDWFRFVQIASNGSLPLYCAPQKEKLCSHLILVVLECCRYCSRVSIDAKYIVPTSLQVSLLKSYTVTSIIMPPRFERTRSLLPLSAETPVVLNPITNFRSKPQRIAWS